jgi:UDP-N-acetyl-2-amino-2-deoxyglucuronate dehydrogenase
MDRTDRADRETGAAERWSARVMSGLGFGFIGAGEIAVESAAAVVEATNAVLVATFDVRADLAEDLATRSGARAVATLDELLAAPDVDAVYICVPHFLHRDTAIRAAAMGKHVFIEKPMGVSPADAEAIVDACGRARVACGVPFVVREAPAYRAAHGMVRSGEIGDITGFRISYRADKPASYWSGGWSGRTSGDWRRTWEKAGGGVLLMNTIHDLDAILWITGLEVERVQAAIATSGGHAEVEDTALSILGCAGGALGSIEALAAVPGSEGPSTRWVDRIYGTIGQILLPSPWSEDGFALFTRRSGEWTEVEPERLGDPRTRAFEAFAGAVLAGTEPPVGGADGVRASRLVHAMYEAARRATAVDPGSSFD